eukprot:1818_1
MMQCKMQLQVMIIQQQQTNFPTMPLTSYPTSTQPTANPQTATYTPNVHPTDTYNNDNGWNTNGLTWANAYCPRWQCDNSSALWDKDYNASFTYQEITQLSW